ncbi:bifunctional glutamate N-acetyltransferase/amino-acid acetyltransferase ArgJ [Pararhodobacter aggregans]|uniref:Arginine biosynthesis bifunctional protein ArgJ n=1 Tax=Pararhodobacter aggregans TaxID=404875 RepID=A0A2T7UMA4_9RHOB|nr:bifunctional glutamate N-acetyltransferase/amino-acid acetyltransferase ArgJ [Pararhodobacter aggregans]PTW99108.1 glutamate N-acetyltransferase [Pararhodobacter aggregans]PVE45832.1 bifunctional ornithine acetyltransferase/N-acetylglutamate synthase [Pararhodobacter aggregans]
MAKTYKEKAKKWKARAKALEGQVAATPAPAPKAKVTLVSPLAPKDGFPALPAIAGVEFATAQAGVRYKNRTDVMLARLAPGSVVAGTFTRSATRSAAVLDCQAKIGLPAPAETGAAILVNSGNSNAFTGARGWASVNALSAAVAEKLGLPETRVFTSSTGVIGEPLPHDKIEAALDGLVAGLAPGGITDAARAIMTTDTYPKGAMALVETEAGPITIAGIAKGSGMIAPDMATMLVYVFTDAAISQKALQTMVSRHTDRSFNAITVDSDTSTSDTLLVAATGQGPAVGNGRSASARAFEKALGAVMLDLAHQVVRDGEGATKFVGITVTGAASDADAKRCALSIANSPLVKTAIAGEDPNWGRIVMAVGKSGAAADRDKLAISFGKIQVATDGLVDPAYKEEDGAAYMKQEELEIGVDLGLGKGRAKVWTCDLTHRYIDINADYRS